MADGAKVTGSAWVINYAYNEQLVLESRPFLYSVVDNEYQIMHSAPTVLHVTVIRYLLLGSDIFDTEVKIVNFKTIARSG